MAIYKGREVTIQNYNQPGLTTTDTLQVTDKLGQNYSVPVGEIEFTEAEKKELKNHFAGKYDQVRTVSDADLKKFRDDQDPEVIQKRVDKQETGKDVAIVAKNAQIDTRPAANTNVKAPK